VFLGLLAIGILTSMSQTFSTRAATTGVAHRRTDDVATTFLYISLLHALIAVMLGISTAQVNNSLLTESPNRERDLMAIESYKYDRIKNRIKDKRSIIGDFSNDVSDVLVMVSITAMIIGIMVFIWAELPGSVAITITVAFAIPYGAVAFKLATIQKLRIIEYMVSRRSSRNANGGGNMELGGTI
jgi:hypothetical protein